MNFTFGSCSISKSVLPLLSGTYFPGGRGIVCFFASENLVSSSLFGILEIALLMKVTISSSIDISAVGSIRSVGAGVYFWAAA